MHLKMLKSKIHRATVTSVDPDYEGSITIDEDLCRAAGVHEFELVLVADCNNGTRHETYVIYGPPGSGEICINGAAARLVHKGDIVIIMAFALVQPDELADHTVRIALVDEHNTLARLIEHETAHTGSNNRT